MNRKLKLAAAIFVATSSAAFADPVTVNCHGGVALDYNITFSSEDAVAVQAVYGSGEAFQLAVCAAAEEQLEKIKDYSINQNEEETLTDPNGTEYTVRVTKLR